MNEEFLLFKTLCKTLEEISLTKKRLEIQEILANYFKKLKENSPEWLISACYLCLGKFLPDHYNTELGVGETLLVKAISDFTNRSVKLIREEHRKTGDYGVIAAKYRANQLSFFKKKDLTIIQVHDDLKKIAYETGNKSQQVKQRIILAMISNTEKEETKYLIRILEGKLKIGLALKTVLISLGLSFYYEDSVELIKYAYNCRPVFEFLIPKLYNEGVHSLRNIGIEPGVPIKPMLAQPTKNITSAMTRIKGDIFTCEYKYDGERAQIHKKGKNYKIYSRNSEDLTEKYPDLCENLKYICKEDYDFILDGEIVAYDLETKKILSFQTLTTRKRKNVSLKDIKIAVCVFTFDVLYFKESLIEKSLEERRKAFDKNFTEKEGKFMFVRKIDCNTVEEIDSFFNKSVEENCEGIMIKNLKENSEYTPSRRCYNWIKLKKDYLTGLADTFDLVVLGCYYGKGKRTGAYGGFLMGCYNDELEKYETVCKLGTGFDDEKLASLFNKLSKKVIDKPVDLIYKEGTQPDLWIQPEEIWEVQAAGLSLSPVYTAGSSSLGNGLSLRFPRFIRERDDKNVESSTNSSQVVKMYYSLEKNDEFDLSEEY